MFHLTVFYEAMRLKETLSYQLVLLDDPSFKSVTVREAEYSAFCFMGDISRQMLFFPDFLPHKRVLVKQ
jgi:hypothetical protein